MIWTIFVRWTFYLVTQRDLKTLNDSRDIFILIYVFYSMLKCECYLNLPRTFCERESIVRAEGISITYYFIMSSISLASLASTLIIYFICTRTRTYILFCDKTQVNMFDFLNNANRVSV